MVRAVRNHLVLRATRLDCSSSVQGGAGGTWYLHERRACVSSVQQPMPSHRVRNVDGIERIFSTTSLMLHSEYVRWYVAQSTEYSLKRVFHWKP
jgi:hypothetical protein